MSSTPPGRRGAEQPHNIAAAIAEVSERATLLMREEIELAKAEVSEKATRLIRGAIVGVAAGIFFMGALVFALVGCAWLLYYFLPGGDFTYFWGFFAMAVILVVLGVIAGLVAARAVKRGAPPVPSMAFEEARKIRETVSAPPHDGVSTHDGSNGASAGGASFVAPPAAPAPVEEPPAPEAPVPSEADVPAERESLPEDGPVETASPGETSSADVSAGQPDASVTTEDDASVTTEEQV